MFICEFCQGAYKSKGSLSAHRTRKHKEEMEKKIRKSKQLAEAMKELSKEPEILQQVMEDDDLVELVDVTLERRKKIDDFTQFSKSLESGVRKPKTSVMAEPRWLSKTLGKGLGGHAGEPGSPPPPFLQGVRYVDGGL